MQYLEEALISYSKSDIYPFHMPGHKKKEWLDITEIDGFDNLHHAQGILKEAQMRAAELYGSRRCFYLVNGSTCGLLAAICAATKKRDKVIVARNSHKAVYHALYLHELSAEYVYPAITQNDLQGQITAEQIENALQCQKGAKAVIVTSPTYEGIISDIKGISDICHVYGVPLIVDAAHGAHLGFGSGFCENPVRQGADAVIMSVHKTLPCLTQTALLHLCSERIAEEKIEKYLGIFETSSPSYLFMAGIEHCIRMIKEQGDILFSKYRKMLNIFYENTRDLKYLHVMAHSDFSKKEAYDWDNSKIIIFTEKSGMLTGAALYERLLRKYHLQMEMASGNYVLAMTSIMDDETGFLRLSEALHEIDWELEKQSVTEYSCGITNKFTDRIYKKNERRMEIYEAEEFPSVKTLLEDAVGKISADTVCLYPPGIPILVPGEKICLDFVKDMKECLQMGLKVEGVSRDKDCIFLNTILY